MDAKIRKFRDLIIKLINESGLPIEVIRLVLFEITTEVNRQSEIAIVKETEEEKKEGEE